MDYQEKMGKCCCTNLERCSQIQKKIIEANRELEFGQYTIKSSTSAKIGSFLRKCLKFLAFPKSIKNVHICKHHFSLRVNEFLHKTSQHINTPISREEAISKGVLDFVEIYAIKKYQFVPNRSFRDAEMDVNIYIRKSIKEKKQHQRTRKHEHLESNEGKINVDCGIVKKK